MRIGGWKCSAFLLICCLCSHSDGSSSRRGLLAPVNVTTKFVGNQVRVHWRYHNQLQPELVSGAYASVSEVVGDKLLGSPVFIHAEDAKTKSIMLSGLMPQRTYSIRVVLFSKDGHSVSSLPVTVRTDESHFSDSKVMLEVNRVTSNSAMLSWKFPLTHSIHGLQFKLNCTGQQAFIKSRRTIHEMYQTKSYMHDALSKYTQEQMIGDLVPNVNYTCELASYSAASEKAFPMAIAHFRTLVGKPRAPEKPRVKVSHDEIKVVLIATTDQYGPISHYKLIAVPVYKDKSEPITMDFTPLVPYNRLVHEAVSSHSATQSDKIVAFVVGTYPSDGLPAELVLGDRREYLSAFKPNQLYVLVLAAFTKTKMQENLDSMFSVSPPSFPPFTLSNSLYTHLTKQAEEKTVGEASDVVLWITGSIASCGIITVVACFGIIYLLKKKGYKIPVKWSDKDTDSDGDIGSDDDSTEKHIFGEKTYVPMKPVGSTCTQEPRVVASEAINAYDNPHFDISLNRTKGLLEDIQGAVDCSDVVGIAAENPLYSPTEISQSPTTFKVKNEEISPAKAGKKLPYSPFTYSTPGELEKLQTGTFSLPRSTVAIKTPRRKVAAAIVKSTAKNKGIPAPAPCKPATITMITADEEEPMITISNDNEVTDNKEITVTTELMTSTSDKEAMMVTKDKESTTITTDEPTTMIANDKSQIISISNDEEPMMTVAYDEQPMVVTNNEEQEMVTATDKESTMNYSDKEQTITVSSDHPMTRNDNDKVMTCSVVTSNEESMTATIDIPTTTVGGGDPMTKVTDDKNPSKLTDTKI